MSDLAQQHLNALDLQEGARPAAPKIEGATEDHIRAGRHLAAIHRHYLMDMARIAAVLRRIEAGDAPPAELRDIVLATDMGENFRAFGSLCGQECRVLTMHHDIEQASMFPRLETAGGGVFAQIVAKLRAEHEVVHELLVRLERAAMALMYDQTDANFAQAAAIFKKLEAVIRSHFKYEETELAEAIGYYLGEI
ncbi:MAG: hemerythrin domain-containing protein [Pseudomonadota bacterium]